MKKHSLVTKGCSQNTFFLHIFHLRPQGILYNFFLPAYGYKNYSSFLKQKHSLITKLCSKNTIFLHIFHQRPEGILEDRKIKKERDKEREKEREREKVWEWERERVLRIYHIYKSNKILMWYLNNERSYDCFRFFFRKQIENKLFS